MTVAKQTRGNRTLYRIRFYDTQGRRKEIRVPGINGRAAAKIDAMVGKMVSARQVSDPYPPAVVDWLKDIPDSLLEKLASAGLVEARLSVKLGEFLDGYISQRSEDKSTNTVRNWMNSRKKLTDHFGEDCDIRRIDSGKADEWRWQMEAHRLAPATVSKAIKHAKQFFAYAVRKRYAVDNPFAHLVPPGEENRDRQAFVPQATIERVIAELPSLQWKAIVALARYGGLRVPSEVMALRWSDVNLETGRFTVTASKKKKHGNAYRAVPIFPELRPYLEDLQELAEGAEHVISDSRLRTHTQLGTPFKRYIRRAGVQPWERAFHNLRASRETELMREHPAHVVCQWLGNDELTAKKHYLQVTDADYAKALGEGVPHIVPQQPAETARNDPQPVTQEAQNPRENAVFPGIAYGAEHPLGESNPCCRTENPES